MTRNQIEYQRVLETQRSAKAQEAETNRSNLARELETQRHNVASEGESIRSNLARELETNRSNVAREVEENRSNLARELETGRHNKQTETTDYFEAVNELFHQQRMDKETERANKAREDETNRANLARELQNYLDYVAKDMYNEAYLQLQYDLQVMKDNAADERIWKQAAADALLKLEEGLINAGKDAATPENYRKLRRKMYDMVNLGSDGYYKNN